jgi:integrase
MYTGFCKENILSLRIESVRLHDLTPTGEVELSVKGGRREVFALAPVAVTVLKRVIGKRREGYVFLNPKTGLRYQSIHHTFNRVVRGLGLTACNGSKLRIHDLRHVFSTWLHREGVTLDSLRALLGHLDRATTDPYTTVNRLEVGKALALMPNLRETRKAAVM